MPKTETKSPHFLIIRLTSLGDVLIGIPVLRMLALQNPNTRFTYLTSYQWIEKMLKDCKNISVVSLDLYGYHKGITGLWRAYNELKGYNFTHIIDWHNVLRSKILRLFLALLWLPTKVINKGRREKKLAIKPTKNKTLKPLEPQWKRYLNIISYFNLNIDSPEKYTTSLPPYFSLEKEKINIGIAPFAKQKSKEYDLNKWKNIIEYFSKHPEFQFYIFGFGQIEQKKAVTTFLESYNVRIVIGNMSKEDELALISSLDLMVSMDSANAHLAAALGVRTNVIYGPTHPFLGFLPIGLSYSDTITPNLQKFPELPVSVFGSNVAKKWARIIDTIPENEIIDRILSIRKIRL